MTLLDLVCSTTWLIRPSMLEAIASLVDNVDVHPHLVAAAAHLSDEKVFEAQRAWATKVPLQMVSAQASKPVEGGNDLARRGATAIVPITGAITRYSRGFASMSGGGQTIQTIAHDFNLALSDSTFTSILLSIDSPGGESNGIAEVADMIYSARGEKPIWAYVSDLGASAAYWLASAADRIVIAQTAGVGSIGCVAVFRDPSKEKEKNLEFVSRASPNKRADLSTEKGRAQVQAMVDTLGDIFVETVARNRGTTTAVIEGDYGAGGLSIGHEAVKAGMAEALGSFEGTLAELAGLSKPVAPARPARRAAQMGLRESFLELVGQLPTEAVATEVVTTMSTPAPSAPTSTTATLALTPTTTPAPAQDEVGALRAQLAGQQAENARLRFSTYQVKAGAWADSMLTDMRAFPSERDHLIGLYVQAAMDDENGAGIDGTLRVQRLMNAVSARTSVKHLTAEALGETALTAIMSRTAPPNDPNKPMTGDRKSHLLSLSPLGQSAQNGAAKN